MKQTLFLLLLVVMPFETHASNKVAEFLQNKTFDSIDHLNNDNVQIYFTDYQLVYSTYYSSGRWYESDDRICIKWINKHSSICYSVLVSGNEIKLFSTVTGKNLLHFTLYNPQPGNQYKKHPVQPYPEKIQPSMSDEEPDDFAEVNKPEKSVVKNTQQTQFDEQLQSLSTNNSPGFVEFAETKEAYPPLDAFVSVRMANVKWRKNEFIFLGNRVVFDRNDQRALNVQLGLPITHNLTLGAKVFYHTWDVESDSSAPANAKLSSARIISWTFVVRRLNQVSDNVRIYIEGGAGLTWLRLYSSRGYTDVDLRGINIQLSAAIDFMITPAHRFILSATHKIVDIDDVNGNEFNNSANILQAGYSIHF